MEVTALIQPVGLFTVLIDLKPRVNMNQLVKGTLVIVRQMLVHCVSYNSYYMEILYLFLSDTWKEAARK